MVPHLGVWEVLLLQKMEEKVGKRSSATPRDSHFEVYNNPKVILKSQVDNWLLLQVGRERKIWKVLQLLF